MIMTVLQTMNHTSRALWYFTRNLGLQEKCVGPTGRRMMYLYRFLFCEDRQTGFCPLLLRHKTQRNRTHRPDRDVAHLAKKTCADGDARAPRRRAIVICVIVHSDS